MISTNDFPSETLRAWFLQNRRSLPWRENPSPYAVWVSEVMLQQTQVSVVLPYFERWMTLFPTLKALASAPLESVIKAWEGLGYYSRCRSLHAGALQIVQEFGGELPSDYSKLSTIKGIGPYTAGAILSFAFHQKKAAVDGNVLRLFARFFGIKQSIDALSTKREIGALAEGALPQRAPWEVVEGMIELGALVCKKKPTCTVCPLRKECIAYREGEESALPIRKKRAPTLFLRRLVAVIFYEDRVLLTKGEKGKVMEDLYEFPYVEAGVDLSSHFEKQLGVKLSAKELLPKQKHTFTRYNVELMPHVYVASELPKEGVWKKKEELKALPFSSGHRKIVACL